MSSMKSKVSSTNSLAWNDSLLKLAPRGKPSKSLEKLHQSGIHTIYDLLWLLPLRAQEIPDLQDFSQIVIGEIFVGKAKIININFTPAYGKKGKSRVQLFNASVTVQDLLGHSQMTLKWFNAYPSLKNQLSELKEFVFLGVPSEYKGSLQITNPKINPKELKESEDKLLTYSTLNSIPGNEIKKILNYIPSELWKKPIETVTSGFIQELNLTPLMKSFLTLHAKVEGDYNKAKERLVYEEFFSNQIKVLARKLKNKKLKAPILTITNDELEVLLKVFPYELTHDQKEVLSHIRTDFKSSHPMMRMVQGDVGCGKTSVALISAIIVMKNKAQVAFMCPTETLATQHFNTIKPLLQNEYKVELLIGSTKAKEKKLINQKLESGEIDLIIGTHALIQDTVQFSNLQFAIIDEQHKFGVEQRQKLYNKGQGVHTLIMTATPIPRTLQLAQYGDLDISTIRVMPGGRKGTKTRIVTNQTYEKYLSFIKTRLTLGEQVYIVVPAIEETEIQNIHTIENIISEYQKYFSEYSIAPLHGQLKSEEKAKTMKEFEENKIQILISTTVIEVGINVLNSTVISIYNPDRFGLSSLHQLRGRVGRGNKPGFCFLVAKDKISQESLSRIKIIERTNDGFEIAEADLKNRGEGNLFGQAQSGHGSDYQIASIFEHFSIFEKVSQDLERIKTTHPEKINNILLKLSEDTKVSTTI